MVDLVISGGQVVDGTGAEPRPADVVISGDRIVEVGPGAGVGVRSDRRIDAEGCLVTPGFIDLHTHFDGQLTWDPVLAPSSLHGVTTVVVGNCGVGFAPARPDRHEWLIHLLEGVEDIPGTALSEGLTWDWETFPEYLDALERRPHTVDVAAHVPHAALRTYVMGDRGADHTMSPTPAELDTLGALVVEALEAGAIGFATSRTEVHRTSQGHNIGTLSAGSDELLTVARAMARAGHGVTQLISDLYQTPDDAFAEAELRLLARFVEVSGRPLSFTMQQAYGAPERWRHQMDWVDRMVAAGHDVKAQVAPRPIGVLEGLDATVNPFSFCGSFSEVALLPTPEKAAALRNPDLRGRILAEHAQLSATLGPGLARDLTCGFEVMFPLNDPVDYDLDPSWSVAAQAVARGLTPAEAVYDLLCSGDGKSLLYLPLFNFAHRNLDDVREMITSPNILLGLSDAGAHCGAICDASFTTSSLAMWGRDVEADRRVGVGRLVHLHTQRQARHVGFDDRGVLTPGMLADCNVIDLHTLACPPPHIVKDLPAGGRRLMQEARGYRYTVKGGLVTFVDGEHTGELPGTLLRSGPRGGT